LDKTPVATRHAAAIRDIIYNRNSSLVLIVQDMSREILAVKPHIPADTRWTAPNELIAGLLGRAIDESFLQPYLVAIEQEVIEASSIPAMRNYSASMMSPGIGFGIPFLADARTGTIPQNELSKITNPEHTLAILILDCWLYNVDRNNEGNLLFESVRATPKSKTTALTLHGIDHALSFEGNAWNIDDLSSLAKEVTVMRHLPIIGEIANRKSVKKHVEKYLKRLEDLEKKDIEWILSQIPEAWGISNTEKSVIMDFIRERQPYVRPAIQKFLRLV
jgi:hypothetical protein